MLLTTDIDEKWAAVILVSTILKLVSEIAVIALISEYIYKAIKK